MVGSSATEVTFLAFAIVFSATVGGAIVDQSLSTSSTIQEASDHIEHQGNVQIEIISDAQSGAIYNNSTGTVTLLVKNTGTATLSPSPEAVSVLINGEYTQIQSVSSLSRVQSRWAPGEVSRITINKSLDENKTHRILVGAATPGNTNELVKLNENESTSESLGNSDSESGTGSSSSDTDKTLLTLSKQTYIYAGSESGEGVHKIDSNGDVVWTYSNLTGSVSSVASNNGPVYVTTTDGGLYKISKDGGYVWHNTSLSNLRDVELTDSGNIYVLHQNNLVTKFGPGGSSYWEYQSPMIAANDIETTIGSGVYISGGNREFTASYEYRFDAITERVDGSGSQVWSERSGISNSLGYHESVTTTESGSVIGAGGEKIVRRSTTGERLNSVDVGSNVTDSAATPSSVTFIHANGSISQKDLELNENWRLSKSTAANISTTNESILYSTTGDSITRISANGDEESWSATPVSGTNLSSIDVARSGKQGLVSTQETTTVQQYQDGEWLIDVSSESDEQINASVNLSSESDLTLNSTGTKNKTVQLSPGETRTFSVDVPGSTALGETHYWVNASNSTHYVTNNLSVVVEEPSYSLYGYSATSSATQGDTNRILVNVTSDTSDSQTLSINLSNDVSGWTLSNGATKRTVTLSGGQTESFYVDIPTGASTGDAQYWINSSDGIVTENSTETITINKWQVLVDNFEDGDLSEYLSSGSGATISTTAYSGSNSVEPTSGVTYSTSGLADYPEQGSEFSYWMNLEKPQSGVAPAFLFGVQDSSNYYKLSLSDTGSFTLEVVNDGSATQLNSSTASVSSGTWYRIHIQWFSDGSMNLSLENSSGTVLTSFSTQDTTYTSGGIGVTKSGKGTAVLDYIRILNGI